MYKGVVLSILASTLFGVMYFYTSLMTPLDGEEIFGWRMLLTVPCATLFMLVSGDWRRVREVTVRLRQQPLLIFALLLSSVLIGAQLLIFMWAPLHGRSLEVSLGYFLLPLSMILTGRIVYGEHLSYLQKVAAVFAMIGVAHELWRLGSFSWETLLVAGGYPLYFVLRRKLRTDHLGGLWFDMLLMLPIGLWFIANGHPQAIQQAPLLYLLIPVLGVISASALVSYIVASRLLPFSLFGLLSYVEPVLLVGVALLLGESIGRDEWLTYLPIWLAVVVLMIEGAKHVLAQRRRDAA
ncbi:chemotaxis protein [Pseudomonas amygdali pv. morsprunorum]|uniref:Chloramphenicol-sensitive protein rarD n=4 Tax=Pseudomonas syringae group TaxID=136849 RepID=A0A3M6ABN4_PSESS|nr:MULTISPECIES: EamA family transporter RarD [Pseudomonas syringae group]KPX02261.1 Chloramphenicol-sensitive protein rarD [Pseudomonas syringae pv. cunninghamiae]KPC39571.1 Chloramphenicol-sensitive protein rarD [Pseudomonas amygdali pv. morsprunorum]KPX07194.1 Chloramphenicol-sensitive protein rarD [Pseudomonas syringae pv. daphniphylli]KPX92801.1 Chloramphenicol-sensitive protein rarD [Pseudomonas meliae]KWS94819.1 chemotaxis protein [Pseudomonas syringae pv. daphniphylli]